MHLPIFGLAYNISRHAKAIRAGQPSVVYEHAAPWLVVDSEAFKVASTHQERDDASGAAAKLDGCAGGAERRPQTVRRGEH